MNHSFFFCLQLLNSFKLRPIRKNLERVSRPKFPTIRNAQPPRKGRELGPWSRVSWKSTDGPEGSLEPGGGCRAGGDSGSPSPPACRRGCAPRPAGRWALGFPRLRGWSGHRRKEPEISATLCAKPLEPGRLSPSAGRRAGPAPRQPPHRRLYLGEGRLLPR